MKTIIYFLLYTFLVCETTSANEIVKETNNTIVDNFPLKIGLKYSYKFIRMSYTSDELFTSGWSDSGQIQYNIFDSSLTNDSLILWDIIECRNYLRRSSGRYPNKDTSYWVLDTIKLQLSESLLTMHEVKCSGIVWNFPLLQFRGNVKAPIYRFMDTVASVMTWKWNGWLYSLGCSGTDTVFVSSTLGFYRRKFKEGWVSGWMGGGSEIMVQQTQEPTNIKTISLLQPSTVQLFQNFPNPFNPSTIIRFTLSDRMYVSLKIFDVLGNEIKVLKDGILNSGEHSVSWNVVNNPSGIYFCRLQTQNSIHTNKLLYIK